MRNPFYIRTALAGALLFGLLATAQAQSNQSNCQQVYPGDNTVPDSTASVSLRISNPGSDSINTKGTFDIPAEVIPVNLRAGQSFNAGVLTANLGSFPANTEKVINVDFQGKPAACVIYGTMSGTWSPKPEAGPATWSQEISFSMILPTEGSGSGSGGGSSQPPSGGGGVNPVPPGGGYIPPSGGGSGSGDGGVVVSPPDNTQSTAPSSPVTDLVQQISTGASEGAEIISKTVTQTVTAIQQSPAVQQAAPPASVAAGAVGAAATAASIPWWNLIQLINLGALGSLKKKERKAWGMVFDKATRRPLSGASVRLFDAASKKQKNVETTDTDGRFGFLVPAGLYYVHVSKSGFKDYESKFIKVTNEQTEALNIEVPLESEAGHFVAIKAAFSAVKNLFETGSLALLIIGTLLSLVILALFPSTLHLIIFLFYIVIDVVKLILDSIIGRSFGLVVDPVTKQPLPLAVVRVFESRFNYLLFTYVTDRNGRFKFLVTPGDYYVTCSKPGFKAYTSELIPIRKSDIIKLDIALAREALS